MGKRNQLNILNIPNCEFPSNEKSAVMQTFHGALQTPPLSPTYSEVLINRMNPKDSPFLSIP